MQVTGRVNKIYENDRNGKVSYSLMIETPRAGEQRFGAWDKPACKENDEVSFEAKSRDGTGAHTGKVFWNVEGTVQVTQAAPAATSGGGGNDDKMTKADWEAKDKRIAFQHAQKVSATLIAVAVEQDALTLGTKKADKLTVLLGAFNDVARDVFTDIYEHQNEDDHGRVEVESDIPADDIPDATVEEEDKNPFC